MLPEHLQLVRKAAEEHGIKNGVIEYETGSESGGHYLGVITAVTVRDQNLGKSVGLILKTAQTSEEVRKKRAVIPAFEREFEFYNHVLPKLLVFQKNLFLSSPFTSVPKYYGGISQNKKEAILLENLKSNGYRLWKNLEPMDFEHMALIFKAYARFHVISLALRQKNPDKFEALTKNIKQNFLEQREAENPEHYQHLVRAILGMGSKAVRGNRRAEEAYKKFEDGYPTFRKRDKENPEKKILVVSHGDCHANNILFKYGGVQDSTEPQKVCFIDWQLSSTESPIRDISFVLCACASKEVLQRSDELFELYCYVIAHNLQEFGCDLQGGFDINSFKEHWKKHLFHGLYRAQTNLKLTLMTQEEFAELGESTSILDALKKDFSQDSKFAHRMQDLYEIVGEQWL